MNIVKFSKALPCSFWQRRILRKHKLIQTKHFWNNIVSITFLLSYNITVWMYSNVTFSHNNQRIWHFHLILHGILSVWHGKISFWQTMCVIYTMVSIFFFMLETAFFTWRYMMFECLFVIPFVKDNFLSILTWLFSIPDRLCLV